MIGNNKRSKLSKSAKAQAWSLDLIVGVVIFILVVVVLYSVLSTETSDEKKLREQADSVAAKIEEKVANPLGLPGLIVDDNINESALLVLYENSTNYDEIKARMGIQNDFCILIVDELGGIVTVGNRTSFGNSEDNLSMSQGIICGN